MFSNDLRAKTDNRQTKKREREKREMRIDRLNSEHTATINGYATSITLTVTVVATDTFSAYRAELMMYKCIVHVVHHTT